MKRGMANWLKNLILALILIAIALIFVKTKLLALLK
jgi:hypothetical protein